MKIPNLILSLVAGMILLTACAGDNSADGAELAGVTWVLMELNGETPLAESRTTLQLAAEQLSGNAGCNHYGGSYEIKGDSLRFDGIYSTEMACLEPDGLMDQELIYLDLLRGADQFELTGDVLRIFSETKPVLVFKIQADEPVSIEPTIEPAVEPAVETENLVVVETAPSPTFPLVFDPPDGWNPYQDPPTGISVYIPEDWIVTGIIEGEYAILQSYPEDKYVGGERREDGDTKCDLNIRPEGERAEDMIVQWQSDPMTAIVSQEEFSFQTGGTGQRFVIDNLGRATVYLAEINQRVVLLACFGDFSRVDAIARTLNALE